MALDNVVIRTSLIDRLKSNLAITIVVPASEIREYQWQGTDFTYPNIRLHITRNEPKNASCDVAEIEFSVFVFSELDSSIEAERIAGIINSELHARSFSVGTTRFSLWRTNLVSAIRIDLRTWRSEVIFRGIVTG